MGQSNITRKLLAGACTAVIASSPFWAGGGQAQPARTSGDVTTVNPVIVNGMAPIPPIGPGATYFTVEDLKSLEQAARIDSDAARADNRTCFYSRGDLLNPPHSERRGDFDLEALYDTEYGMQLALEQAAKDAEDATQAALDARGAAARGQADRRTLALTELLRQKAVLHLQSVQYQAGDAHARVADLQDQIMIATGGFPGRTDTAALVQRDFQNYVDDQSLQRSHNGGIGGIFVPDEFKDLRLSNVVARQKAEPGGTVIRFTGKINNPRKTSISVPPLWVAAVDVFGTPLKSQQIVAPSLQGKIPAGGSLTFAYELKPMPDHTAHAVVTFAPVRRTPQYLPVGMFCDESSPVPSNPAAGSAPITPSG